MGSAKKLALDFGGPLLLLLQHGLHELTGDLEQPSIVVDDEHGRIAKELAHGSPFFSSKSP